MCSNKTTAEKCFPTPIQAAISAFKDMPSKLQAIVILVKLSQNQKIEIISCTLKIFCK